METESPPPQVGSTDQAPPPNPALNAHKKRSPLKIILIVILSIIGLGLIAGVVIIAVVISALSSADNSCTAERISVYHAAQQAEPSFNRLVIILGLPVGPASEQKQAGDCIDSTPTAWLQRSVTVNETAEAALSQVTSSLRSQGYKGPSYDNGANPEGSPCVDDQGLTFFKQSLPDVTITMNCEDSQNPNGTWQSLQVTQVDAQLTFST